MLISCVLQCTDGLRLIKRLENYAYRMSEKTAYRSLEKSAYRSLKKLLTVHLQIHLTACRSLRCWLYCVRRKGRGNVPGRLLQSWCIGRTPCFPVGKALYSVLGRI